MKRTKWILAALLSACLLLPHPIARAEESGLLRVYLKSLGAKNQLTITLAGRYSVNGNELFQFDEGTVVTVIAYGGQLLLRTGGVTMGMGESFTLRRHASAGEGGVYIEGSQRGKLYLGGLRLSNSEGRVRAVLDIDVEDYLYGVVPYEMSDSFPLEALKAQAVAARTYALKRRADSASRDYDLVDTPADQVFMGYDSSLTNAIRAVDETRGVAGLYGGQYASCFYTATNGGQTALADMLNVSGDYGYLDIRDDPYDVANPSSPVRRLTYRADGSDLDETMASFLKLGAAEQLASMGYSDEEADVEIVSIVDMEPRNPLLNESYRLYGTLAVRFTVRVRPVVPVYEPVSVMEKIRANWEDRPLNRTIAGYELGEPVELEEPIEVELSVFDQLKRQLGLKLSNIDCELLTVAKEKDEAGNATAFSLEMRRYGHGVGMSQRGAQWMAGEFGKSYQEILSFYYPGLTFTRVELSKTELTELPALSAAPVQTAAQATPAPTQAPLPEPGEGEYYARVTLSSDGSSLNVRRQPSTSAPILGELANGWRVIVTSLTEDGWAYVKTGTLAGYVSNAYLTKE